MDNSEWVPKCKEMISKIGETKCERRILYYLLVVDVDDLLDSPKNKQMAHKLKSNSKSLYIKPLKDEAEIIENRDNRNNIDINENINKIKDIMKYIEDEDIFDLKK